MGVGINTELGGVSESIMCWEYLWILLLLKLQVKGIV